jgi:hypothetical protein
MPDSLSAHEKYLPPDYRTIPWEKRPLSMRLMERMTNQPMEEIIAGGYFRYKRIFLVAKSLSCSERTLRLWMQTLGLYACVRCSPRTGLLHSHARVCDGCARWYCDECLENHILYKPPLHGVYLPELIESNPDEDLNT